MKERQKLINGESISEPNMQYDVVFFDFDGTLVDSAAVKRQAFFDLFPDTEGHTKVVQMVLEADPDGSRYLVIPRMVEEMRRIDIMVPEDGNSDRLTQQYARNVLHAVCRATEMPGAKHLLETLHSKNTSLYLCSNTPHEAIVPLVKAKHWDGYFQDIVGYPTVKDDFVRRTIERNGVPVERVAYIGDGISDRKAAASSGIKFYCIRDRNDLIRIGSEMEGVVNL
mgnify:CR=1 FL=1|jgi:phosphoglycolate phosphatase